MKLFVKKDILLFLFITLLILSFDLNAQTNETKPVKIACVGNSITFGHGISNRENNAYPVQLQNLLGDRYKVENFGHSGRTLLKKGDYPYWNSDLYKKALQFDPDIVYIMLGTNDSKLQNRVHLNEFEKDYTDLINSFKKKNNKIKIVVLLPIPSFLKDTSSIWDPVIKDRIIPKLEKVAYDTHSEVIDLYQLFIDKPQLLPDKIHPSSLGATLIAKRIYEDLKIPYTYNFNIMDKIKVDSVKTSDFHGFLQYNFKYKGNLCRIVVPKKVAEGKPWALRARFWGHEPQTDIALLERGFHIAYCDVADLYGAPEAVKRWNKFYKQMKKAGLSKKVVLEGMSRGGLIIYNWAVKNPEKVACIYADAPVLDGKSWPGGFGKSKGNADGWAEFKKVYHLNSEKKLANFKKDPIHQTQKISKGKYPMLHICGEADQVVPVDENTRIFEKEIKGSGGNIEVIYKKGVDHHPHSLKNPSPIVNFILRNTDHKINFATIPAPGSEYRTAAGWKKGKGWWAQMYDIDSLCMNSGKADLLLIGNSITQGWGGTRAQITSGSGQKAADKYFKDKKWINAGISGDRTQHVAWRVIKGHYDTCDPDTVVLAIGVNNFPDNTADEIIKGIELDLDLIKKKIPRAKILLYGPLPTGTKADSRRRKKYNDIHRAIKDKGNDPRIEYINLLQAVTLKNGDLNPEYYSKDGIHLIPAGFNIWAESISKFIQD